MPQQLIYTSAPRGIVAGRSGHCTVARSATMREALMLQLEKLSYYQHLSLSGGQERPIFACRIVDLRGTRFHVLTRIQDAGLDFTGRTNFIAHHLVFTPEEIRQYPTPPVILRDWTGWAKAWPREPELFQTEDWSEIAMLADKTSIPAQTWYRVTGDATNGYGLLEARSGSSFRVDELSPDAVLGLFAESVELLEVRDPRRDFRAASWQCTFTTSIQEQDNPTDFRWRCVHADNPAAAKTGAGTCPTLASIRASKCTEEETVFARGGRQPPRFVAEPQDIRVTEGEAAHLSAAAKGVPAPVYQWFAVDRTGNANPLADKTNQELVIDSPPFGVSRYFVQVSNSAGEAASRTATVSVEQKLRLAQPSARAEAQSPLKRAAYQKSEEEIDRQRNRIAAEQAQERAEAGRAKKKVLVALIIFLSTACLGGIGWIKYKKHLSAKSARYASKTNQPTTSAAQLVTNVLTNASIPPQNSSRGSEREAQETGTAKTQAPNTNSSFQREDSFVLPGGWEQIKIGSVSNARAECVTSSNFRFDLTAAEGVFHEAGDSLLFVCKTNVGTEFRALVSPSTNLPHIPQSAKWGIMLRESQDSKSPFVFIGAFNKNVYTTWRDFNTQHWEEKLAAPITSESIYFKFYQKDSQGFTGAYSFDNQHWNDVPQPYPFPSHNNSLVGFALCPGDSEIVSAYFWDRTPTINSPNKK